MTRLLLPASLLLTACQSAGGGSTGGPNLFSVEDDVELGRQVRDEILADPANYPILDEAMYPEAYGHVRRIRDVVLASGDVANEDVFAWEVYIIEDDETLNAFATPGGYMFFYTGLIKFLDREDHFAGVMGHEMAHAAQRHSTQQLTQQYGLTVLLELVFGEDQGGTAGEIAAGLASLRFSRDDETQADVFSVDYLCDSDKAADGAAGFFRKIEEEFGGSSGPEFLSTHPDPGDRVETIEQTAVSMDCNLTPDPDAQWEAFQASLP